MTWLVNLFKTIISFGERMIKMSRRLISNMEKNIIKDACYNGSFKGVTWGDVCEEQRTEARFPIVEDFINELLENNINPDVLHGDVFQNAMSYGYKIINNHFMAYTDNTKTWYIDQWL